MTYLFGTELFVYSLVCGASFCLSGNSGFHFGFLLLKKGEKGRQLQGGTAGSLDAEMEKLLEDSVMCRARAKRGCATHPRSIAERVLMFLVVVIFIYTIRHWLFIYLRPTDWPF